MDNEQNIYTQPSGEDIPRTWDEPAQQPKRSPFADSPYEMPHIQTYTSRPDTASAAQEPPQPKKKRNSKSGKVLLCLVLAVALVAGSCLATALVVNEVWENQNERLIESFNNKIGVLQSQIDAMADSGGTVSGGVVVEQEGYLTPGQVYAANVKAVVAITGSATETDIYGYSEYEKFGSGFIISQDGYVVSNYHVVEGVQDLTVITYDEQEYPAELIGYDATNDISLLKIDAQDLPCVTIGSSDALAVGDQVAAIGNPLGELTATLTVGYVSAKDRIVTTDGSTINMLQTDAAINSGNSGGPLFNMKGEVVGIITAKYSGTSSSGTSIEGIGFAIPMDDVNGMLEDLRDYGYITGAYLGVMVRDVDAYGQGYGLPAGVYVEEVTPGYAAEAAGVKAQDIIVDIGGYEITCMTDLSRVLRKFEAGETTTIVVYRNGQEVHLYITLDEKPVETVDDRQEQSALTPGDEDYEDWYGEFIDRFFGG